MGLFGIGEISVVVGQDFNSDLDKSNPELLASCIYSHLHLHAQYAEMPKQNFFGWASAIWPTYAYDQAFSIKDSLNFLVFGKNIMYLEI